MLRAATLSVGHRHESAAGPVGLCAWKRRGFCLAPGDFISHLRFSNFPPSAKNTAFGVRVNQSVFPSRRVRAGPGASGQGPPPVLIPSLLGRLRGVASEAMAQFPHNSPPTCTAMLRVPVAAPSGEGRENPGQGSPSPSADLGGSYLRWLIR